MITATLKDPIQDRKFVELVEKIDSYRWLAVLFDWEGYDEVIVNEGEFEGGRFELN